MFRLGIIDDDLAEASSISLTLVTNADEINEESFKLYELKKENNFKENLFKQILNDIEENTIQCLIVDYKLDVLNEVMEGIEIVDYLHNAVPEFPVIILTNVTDASKNNDKADPDKVYAKEDFMNPEKETAKDMVYNIVRNLERYTKHRGSLEYERDMCLEQILREEKYEDENYKKLIEAEKKLSKYKPLQMTSLDEMYDMTEMKEALEVLKEYKKILE